MRKVALGITTTVALLVAVVLPGVVTGWMPRGPMNHGWDWPWHDWWHSAGAELALSARPDDDQNRNAGMGGRSDSYGHHQDTFHVITRSSANHQRRNQL